jgi:DNA primase
VPGLIPEQVIAEIRERTDIVQVIGQHVQLKRSGVNHIGLCPFHDEKTPSFNVNSQRQFFHCFGCHESGDVIKFLMKVEGRRFLEVVEDLAARAGIEIPRQTVSPTQAREVERQRSERQLGIDLNRKIADLYRSLLLGDRGGPAREYLQRRGVGDAIAETFQLGYAPPTGAPVARLLEREKVSMDVAERLGLVLRRAGGGAGGFHDRFWNRLIFPVIGAGGEVLGFGGRLLGDGDGPKYINTPETPLYHKGEVLFGLAAAAAPMRKKDQALVVEGNIDVIQLHQHGFDHAVAPMGTALTARQVQLLRRFAGKVIAVFDGDAAGQAAALKAVRTFVDGGLSAKIASLPAGHDPDSFLREKGAEAMGNLLAVALPAVDFLIETLQRSLEDTIPDKARLLEEVAPVVAQLPRVDRDLYAHRLALALRVDAGVVQRAIKGSLPTVEALRHAGTDRSAPPAPLPSAELYVLGILFEHSHLFPRAEAAGLSSLLTNGGLRATYSAAMEMQQTSGRIEPASLLESLPEEVRNTIAELFQPERFTAEGDPTKALDDCISTLRREGLKREKQDIRSQIAAARAAGRPDDEVRELASRLVEVEREIHETR